MASSLTKGLHSNERYKIHQDSDSWTYKLIERVGRECILEVFLGTQVLEDLRLLRDCKPASVSNWSFDENCHFCCLRREKVKDHVVSLNKQIVESGGKPLLGKDPSNINRIEGQSEEFLNAVLHKKEYKPRIPDPHIPVVACGILQQMITQLSTQYTSRNNICSPNFLQHDESKNQTLVKSPSLMSTALMNDKIIMMDQDAPLDLSMKKIKVEDIEQDCVLDLSTKKNCNNGRTSLRNSHVSPALHLAKRSSVESNPTRPRDLQSSSTLEEFMSKLCLHHQRQIVDALNFLQAEVKTISTSNQTLTPTLSDKQQTTSCSCVTIKSTSEIERSVRTCPVDTARTVEPFVVRTAKKENIELSTTDVSSIVPPKPVDLCKASDKTLLTSSGRAGKNANKSQRGFIMTTSSSGPQGAKQVSTDSETISYNVERPSTAESDHTELINKSPSAQNKDDSSKPSTVQRTSDVVLHVSPRTARKTRKSSFLCHRNGSCYVVNDPDSHCDLVFVKKSITECQLQSQSRLHPRRNARKSTRGHRYVEEYLELKTVRTLAGKFVSDAGGNCLTRMPDVHTSVTPRQPFTIPDSVPLMSAPFTGDCIKDVVQMADNEVPGDVVKESSQGLIVETSQTGKTESNDQITHEPADKPEELCVQDAVTEAVGCVLNTVETHDTHTDKDVIDVNKSSDTEVQRDECSVPLPINFTCDSEDKSQDQSVDFPSTGSPNTTKDDSADDSNVEPNEDVKMLETAINNEENKSAQEQVETEPEKNQGDKEMSSPNKDTTVDIHTEKIVSQTDLHEDKIHKKQEMSSDRCLRSKGAVITDLKITTENINVKIPETLLKNLSLKSNVDLVDKHDLKSSDDVSTDLDDHHTVRIGLNRSSSVENDESKTTNLQNYSEELPSVGSSVIVQEISSPKSEKQHKLNKQTSEKTPEKVNKANCSPIKKSSPSSESMLLRSRSGIERLSSIESNNLMTADQSEKQDPSKNNEQGTKQDVPASSSTSLTHMPLRNKSNVMMKATQGSSDKPSTIMSLRRGNVSPYEKSCESTTPPNKNKCPQRQPKTSMSSGVECSPSKTKIKIEKNTETQIQESFSLSDQLLSITGIQRNEPVSCSPPKFLEALRAKEHQQVISNLNTKFDKMHKGWIQSDKESQPVSKPKNKSDRLKEIWKSKRRIRKSRPLEQQKCSPVQMLFMKPYDLSSICKWFLQTTETKPLVIVKKLNTRLPSETQLCFHSSSAGAGSAHGIFPSLQAERLKKHLKKFAIASPVKNNPKNQRLLSKALGQDISTFHSKEKSEPKTATRISTKAQSLAGAPAAQSPESLCAAAVGPKNPASARIIKKYSNIREKLQVQQIKKRKEKTFQETRLKPSVITKKAAKRKLVAPKGKSVIVRSIKSMKKKTKSNSAVKERTLKKKLSRKAVTSSKKLRPLGKVKKANPKCVTSSKKLKIKTKAQKTKANRTKVNIKKSVHNKVRTNNLKSLDSEMKPQSLDDQVLTRSQRKIESTPSQIGSPKSSTKRGLDPLVTPSKRARTSKP